MKKLVETVSIPKEDYRALTRISSLLSIANSENTKHNATEKLCEAIHQNEIYRNLCRQTAQ